MIYCNMQQELLCGLLPVSDSSGTCITAVAESGFPYAVVVNSTITSYGTDVATRVYTLPYVCQLVKLFYGRGLDGVQRADACIARQRGASIYTFLRQAFIESQKNEGPSTPL